MNHSGEIKRLCEIAEPDAVAVTMVGAAHIGELGSMQAVMDAKQEIYDNTDGIKIFNMDNGATSKIYEKVGKSWPEDKKILFGTYEKEAAVNFRVMDMDFAGLKVKGTIKGVEGEFFVPVFGRHNNTNLMTATSMALACGMTPEEIWAALPGCKGSWGRNQLVELESGAKVLFDAYNANPDSMSVLIKNLFEMFVSGKKVVVVGEMLELGNFAEAEHEKLGEMIGNTDVELVWFIGPSFKAFERGIKTSDFSKISMFSDSYEESLAIKIGSVLQHEDVAVIKGSRGIRLERVLQSWKPVNFSS